MPDFLRPLDNFTTGSPFNRSYKERLEHMAQLVMQWRDYDWPLVKILKKRWEQDQQDRWLRLIIVNWPLTVIGPNRWEYLGYRCVWDEGTRKWVEDPNNTTPYRLQNSAENINTEAQIRRTVWVGSTPYGFVTCLPIAHGRSFMCRHIKDDLWEFSEPNDVQVDCTNTPPPPMFHPSDVTAAEVNLPVETSL